MDSKESDELSRRLDRLEQLVHDLADRVGHLEHPAGQVAPTVPPPVIREQASPSAPVAAQAPSHPPLAFQLGNTTPVPPKPKPEPNRPAAEAPKPPPTPPPTPAKPVRDGANVDDIEYKIGMTGLLRGGAVIVILGMLYLVALGITRGWITPTLQFAGELMLCTAFIGVGQWKRKEREEFGQILTGIGSCGLYFSIAAAYVFKHLYQGETVVVLFTLLSLVNLGYSFWQSSRAFLVIGLVGGLIGSVLPMREDRASLTMILHLLVVIPTAAILIRNRWTAFVTLMWTLSALSLIPVFYCHDAWPIRLSAMYATTVIAIFAYARTFDAPKWDPDAALIPLAATAAALGGLMLDYPALRGVAGSTNPAHGSYQVLILSAILGLMAFTFRASAKVAQSLALTAVGIAAVLGPIGLERTPEAFTYLTVSLGLSLVAVRLNSRPLLIYGWSVFGLGLMAYIAVWSTDRFNLAWESQFLGFAIALAALHSWALTRLGQASETASIIGSVVSIPMLLRLGEIWIRPAWGDRSSHGFFVVFGAITALSYAVCWLKRWPNFWVLGTLNFAAMLLAYLDGFPYSPGLETVLLVILVGLSSAATYVSSVVAERETQTASLTATVLAIPVLLRLGELWIRPAWGDRSSHGFFAVFAFVTALGIGVSWRKRWPQFWGLALTSFVAMLFAYLDGFPYPAGVETLLLGITMALSVAGTYVSNVVMKREAQSASLVASVMSIPILLRLGELWIRPAWGDRSSHGFFIVLGFVTVVSLGLSFRQQWRGFWTLALLSLLGMIGAYIDGFPYPPGIETLLIAAMISLSVGVSYVSGTFKLEILPLPVAGPTALLTGMVARLSVVWLAETHLVPTTAAVAIGLLLSAHIAALIVPRYRWLGTLVVGWMAALVGGAMAVMTDEMVGYFENTAQNVPASKHLALDLGLLVAAHTALLLIARATKLFELKTRSTELATAIFMVPLWTRLGQLSLTQLVGMNSGAAISASWIAYACICLAVGFRRRIQVLRFFSFAVFAVSVGKVMLIDLVGLDAGIRVVILLFLGVTMIIGGYVYIRARADQLPPASGDADIDSPASPQP